MSCTTITFLYCRHTSSDPSYEAAPESFGGWQRDAQPATVTIPPEPFHDTVVQTPTDTAAPDDQPVTNAYAPDGPQVTVGGWRATATTVVVAVGPEQHVERGRRPALDVQTAAAVVRGHVLPTGGRHNQPVRRVGAQPAERFKTRFADRYPDTGARSEDLSGPCHYGFYYYRRLYNHNHRYLHHHRHHHNRNHRRRYR